MCPSCCGRTLLAGLCKLPVKFSELRGGGTMCTLLLEEAPLPGCWFCVRCLGEEEKAER